MSLPIGITSGFFLWGGCNTNGSGRKDLIVIITQQMCFSFLPYKFFDVFTMKSTTFLINVLTWHGQQRVVMPVYMASYMTAGYGHANHAF
jgi:hypothetical protein